MEKGVFFFLSAVCSEAALGQVNTCSCLELPLKVAEAAAGKQPKARAFPLAAWERNQPGPPGSGRALPSGGHGEAQHGRQAAGPAALLSLGKVELEKVLGM